MAHTLSSQKRIRQAEKKTALNRWRKTEMRTALKEFRDKLLHASLDDATAAYRVVSQMLDRTAAKGVIHKNQAARRKSRMAAKLKARKDAGLLAAPPSKK